MSLNLELRNISLKFDLSNLHKNVDRPHYYFGWLAVSESKLGPKGAGHRVNRRDTTLAAEGGKATDTNKSLPVFTIVILSSLRAQPDALS